MNGLRDNAAAGILAAFGILLIWIGFSGRLGVVLAAILCPAQVISVSGQGAMQPSDIQTVVALQSQVAAAVAAQAAQAGVAVHGQFNRGA